MNKSLYLDYKTSGYYTKDFELEESIDLTKFLDWDVKNKQDLIDIIYTYLYEADIIYMKISNLNIKKCNFNIEKCDFEITDETYSEFLRLKEINDCKTV